MREFNLPTILNLQKIGLNLGYHFSFAGQVFFHPPVNINIGENFSLKSLVIDSYTTIGVKCNLFNTWFGCYCTVGNNVNIGFARHALNEFSTTVALYTTNAHGIDRNNSVFEKYHRLECVSFIGSDVQIGNDVYVYNDAKINTGAVIRPNTIITKDVPPFAIVERDNKIVGYRFSDEIISDLLELKWWDLDLPKMMQKGLQIPMHDIQEFIQFMRELAPQDKIFLSPVWIKFEMNATSNSASIKQASAQEALDFMLLLNHPPA